MPTLYFPFSVSVGFLALALLTAGCAEEPPPPGPTAKAGGGGQPVILATVRYQPEVLSVEAVGTSRALQSVVLTPAVTGEVRSIEFTADQKVERGQILLRLDDRSQRLAVELAEVELEEARRLLQRFRNSLEGGGVTQSELDTAATAVDRARIALQQAELTLEYHSIIAPFAGHVGWTDIDPGVWIGPDTAITTLDDRSALLVSFALPEILLGQLPLGQVITLSTWSDRSAAATGTIVDIDSRVDQAQRTFTLRARVDNSADELRPGMSFRVQLALAGNHYPTVSEMALQWGGDGAYVWQVEDGIARRVTASIVQRSEGSVLVDADLPPGSQVVVEGVQAMRDGLAVRPLAAPGGAAQ